MDYTYSYDYMYGEPATGSTEVLGVILMIYAVIIGGVLLVKLAGYVIKGLAMYRMAQRAGMEYPWLAFVPFARVYLQGELSGDLVFKKRTIRDPGIWLILIPVIKTVIFGVVAVVTWVAVAGMVVTAVYTNRYAGPGLGIGFFVVLFVVAILAYQALISALKLLVNCQIYRKFTSENLAIVHALLGILLPLYESICLFVYRNKPYLDGQEPTDSDPTQAEEATGAETSENMTGESTVVNGNGEATRDERQDEGAGEPYGEAGAVPKLIPENASEAEKSSMTESNQEVQKLPEMSEENESDVLENVEDAVDEK